MNELSKSVANAKRDRLESLTKSLQERIDKGLVDFTQKILKKQLREQSIHEISTNQSEEVNSFEANNRHKIIVNDQSLISK